MNNLVKLIATKFPYLKKQLKMARIKKTPEQAVLEAIKSGLLMGGLMTVMVFFLVDSRGYSYAFIPLGFFILTLGFFYYSLLGIQSKIISRRKIIDRDVLFSGRFLLVKLNSGQPLINALIDASNSPGVANDYFKEIVEDIQLGKSLEHALSDASDYSPSDKLRRILFQISNAIKIGIDVTEYLESTLDDVAHEQILEIERYGKKLNSLTLFYMLLAVVLPSLGLTIMIVVVSLMNIEVGILFFGIILFFLITIQLLFLITYKAIRPDINI
ncbi:MAG: type II secretion system F family protein [Candidatus Woesearchaeota archaeon]